MRLQDRLDDTFVVAHRGYMSAYTENSLLAFGKAVEAGVDAVEMDLHYTRDDQIVVIHDDTIDRTTTGQGRVSELTMGDIQSQNLLNPDQTISDEKVPTFLDYLELTKEYTDLIHFVEIKDNFRGIKLLKEIDGLMADYKIKERVVIISSDYNVLVEADNLGYLIHGLETKHMRNLNKADEDYYKHIDIVGMFVRDVDQERVESIRALGPILTLVPVNTEKEVNLTQDLGIHILVCNDIKPALEYREKGQQ